MADPTDVSDDEILVAFAQTDSDPLRPGEVERDLPIPLDDLRDRVDDLTELGLLRSHEDRQSGVAYSLTDEGAARAEAAGSDVVTEVEAQATATSAGSLPRDHETVDSPPPEPGRESVEPPYELPDESLETFDVPGSPADDDDARAALRAAYDYLRERGTAERSDFVADVFSRAPAGYDDATDGWWDDVVEPGLEHLPGPERRDDEWAFEAAAAESGGED